MEVIRKNYTLEIEEPTIHVDNGARGRSGHMSHALASFAPNTFIDFNANYSAVRNGGHYCYGWIEYSISKDSGKTFSELRTFPYSMKCFEDGLYTISVEKAVGCDDGTIVAFCLRNSALENMFCVPWETPTVVRSTDGGETWGEATELCEYKGRVYSAFCHEGAIYVLMFCNDYMWGQTEEHKYRLYKSTDNGVTFEEVSVVPFNTLDRAYGTMLLDQQGVLHVFVYNRKDEFVIDHAISKDMGKTWEILDMVPVNEGIRNPQLAYIDGVYVMHGRSWCKGGIAGENLVLYTSEDAYHWDEAIIIAHTKPSGQYYSDNLNLTDENGNFLLIQYSETIMNSTIQVKVSADSPVKKCHQVNAKHMRIRVKR